MSSVQYYWAKILCVQAGYAVIFLSRLGSLQPFANQLPQVRCAADLKLLVDDDGCRSPSPRLTDAARSVVRSMWPLYSKAQSEKRLMTVQFTTLFEYLRFLEVTSCCLHVRVSLSASHDVPGLVREADETLHTSTNSFVVPALHDRRAR
jgi:hypothetical protein